MHTHLRHTAIAVVVLCSPSFVVLAEDEKPTQVACVGDSITAGAGPSSGSREVDSYPANLQRLLGSDYNVTNFGVGGCTLIRKGRPNVWSQLERIRSANPDMVIISLGTNDTCRVRRKCWDHKDRFSEACRDLIDAIVSFPSKPRVWICAPTPMVLETPGLSEGRKQNLDERKPRLQKLIKIIEKVAQEKNVGFIDLNTPMAGKPDLFTETDGVHPNKAGYETIAQLVHAELTQVSCATAKRNQFSAVETDKRLHADGKDWRLDMAHRVDPERPRVLLIGDSILNGYRKYVIEALDHKAYVDTWVTPMCQSAYTNRVLAKVLDQGPYDVVHFNMGLHGWPEGRIKEGTFEPLTKAYVEVIREKLPQASIIWANTTPVTVKDRPTELDPRINPTIVEHNRMAANVMDELDVPENDFYGLLIDKLELARGDQFHWKPEAYRLLAEQVTESVLRELKTTR